MIKVQDLTKIYKSKNRTNCMALDHISFTLPDNGMVFVLGKSGSGKSTLLNLLGGLDEFEEGEIFFEDEKLSAFTQTDFYDYRCRHIGFVFQDFHLLEELTVEQNVALVLDLESRSHGALVQEALAKVGMAEYATRYPCELSGGQKQRVAIARAIVKSPEVILCDEPTGNLDYENSRQILNLLKEFSKTNLVMIVSHNLHDAQDYADRVLELRDGKIVRDQTRRPDYNNAFGIEDGQVLLPYNKALSREQVGEVMEAIREGGVTDVVQHDNGLVPTESMEFQPRKYTRRNAGMSIKTTLYLTRVMMRKQYLRFLITALIATLLVSCFAVFQSFLHYDLNTTFTAAMLENDYAASRLNTLLITFTDLFRMFEILLLSICIIYLASFGVSVMQRNKYQIGIIKSLGGKTAQIAGIFIAQLMAVGFLILLLSGAGIKVATKIANEILMGSIEKYLHIEISNFEIIEFVPELAFVDLFVVLMLIMVSSLVPLYAIHKIRPINIIKAKD